MTNFVSSLTGPETWNIVQRVRVDGVERGEGVWLGEASRRNSCNVTPPLLVLASSIYLTLQDAIYSPLELNHPNICLQSTFAVVPVLRR